MDGLRTQAVTALVLHLVSLVACCNVLGVPGAVLAGLALRRAGTTPRAARRLLLGCWALLGLGALFVLAGITVLAGLSPDRFG
ncbi:hypothetical protein D5H75_09830 [Bailinhaonella thermotolerans]|uniref:DUF4190 domain-containing protein n=1 Tax=Bailinhaonella thermotolerans TaxID=1070861 RepID=A0A3A4BF94_9ACTN|nr:hypothetical protein D5H75_09830 [Bailinhaonella thermotolerans]